MSMIDDEVVKSEESRSERASVPLTFVVVGDEGVGKSALIHRFIAPNLAFSPGHYVPTIREDYMVTHQVKDGFRGHLDVDLTIVDTGGQPDLDRFRPLSYNEANVFILCFSVVAPFSFQALNRKWVKEIRRHSSQSNILLVGTHSDLRSNTSVLLELSTRGLAPVSEARAIRLSQKIGAKNYIECSAVNRKNTKQVFDYGMMVGLQKVAKIPMLLSNLETNLDEMIFPEGRGNSKMVGKENNIFPKHQRRVTKHLRKGNKLKRLLFLSCLFR